MCCEHLPSFYGLTIIFSMAFFFWWADVLILIKSIFSSPHFVIYIFCILSKRSLGHKDIFFCFLVFTFTFRSIIYLSWIYFCSLTQGQDSLFFIWISTCSNAICLRHFSFPSLNGFGIFVKNQVTIYVWASLWTFYFVPLIYLPIRSPKPYFLNFYSFIVNLKIW